MPLKINLSLVFLILITLSNCANETFPKHELIEKIIRPRFGYEGSLTNRYCIDENCYTDAWRYNFEFRKTLIRLGFICNIGGKRYHPCEDEKMDGFCRNSTIKTCKKWDVLKIFCSKKIETDFIGIKEYQYLIDANTRCYNREKYNF